MNPFNQPYSGYGQATLASPSSHLCEFLKKPVIFVIGLFATLSALISLVGEILITNTFGTIMDSISLWQTGMKNSEFEFMKNFFSIYLIVIFSVSTIMTLLNSIPYLTMYFRSKSGKKPTGSVTVLQVVSIITLVGACALALLALLYIIIFSASASMMSAAESSGLYGSHISSGTTAIVPMIIVIIILVAIAALNLTYAIGFVRLAFSAKSILTDRSSKLKNAGLVGVFNIMSAVFSIFRTISSIIMLITLIVSPLTAKLGVTTFDAMPEVVDPFKAAIFLWTAAVVLNCVVMISKAVAAFGAKRHMNCFIGMPPQSPTSYYNDGYSNQNQNGFNPYQNGYTNTNTNTNANPYAGNPFGGSDMNSDSTMY
ncbi:MAG: hypothetical protein ACI4RP_00110 [Acutalibacteraceae bacterium]